jgi:hypothetical protein
MENPTANEIIKRMEADWPHWQVWVVNRVVGGPVWCARRWDDNGQVLNAGSADELADCLEEASTPVSEPETDYTGYAMYQEAVRAYPGQPAFAAWLCEQHPWGGVDMAEAHDRWAAGNRFPG